MHQKTGYRVLMCLMVVFISSTTADDSNSTFLSQETTTTLPQENTTLLQENSLENTTFPQENLKDSTTMSTEEFIQCPQVKVNITELFKCQKSEYFQNLSTQISSLPEKQRLETQYWMTCWMTSCLEEVNTFKYLTIIELLARSNNAPLRKNLIHSYTVGVIATNKAMQHLESVTQFFEKFLISQNNTLREINSTTQLDNSTDQSTCQHLSPECTSDLNRKYVDFLNLLSELNTINVYKKYVHPALLVLIFCAGLMWNGTLVLMFILNKDLRIIPNTMLINNAVNDMLLLLIGIPLQYYVNDYNLNAIKLKYQSYNITFQTLLSFVSASSVLAMSIQRYLAITRSLSKQASLSDNPRRYVIVNILAVWLSSLGVSLLLYYTTNYNVRHGGKTFWENIIGHILITIFITIALTVFNILTAVKLKHSVKDIPGETSQSKLLRSRYRSSNIIIALTVVFWFTHGLYLLQAVVKFEMQIQFYNYVHSVVYCLYFSTTFLNPIALCVSSNKFRTLFKKYLIGWCIKPNKLL